MGGGANFRHYHTVLGGVVFGGGGVSPIEVTRYMSKYFEPSEVGLLPLVDVLLLFFYGVVFLSLNFMGEGLWAGPG